MAELSWLNRLPEKHAREAFLRCCGSELWAVTMTACRPFEDEQHLFQVAAQVWEDVSKAEKLAAFAAHPKIGHKPKDKWAAGEQAGAAGAEASVLEELAALNAEYEKKFGYIYIVCATGKTAPEMLALLKQRLGNDAATELRVAAAEQAKITQLRLEKLLKEGDTR